VGRNPRPLGFRNNDLYKEKSKCIVLPVKLTIGGQPFYSIVVAQTGEIWSSNASFFDVQRGLTEKSNPAVDGNNMLSYSIRPDWPKALHVYSHRPSS
jgi:hypothetical protein